MLLLPRFPRRFAGIPERLQQFHFTISVHALPKRFVSIRHELTVRRQLLQWSAFPFDIVGLDVVKYLWLEDEKGAVDPPLFGLCLLGEFGNLVPIQFKMAESSGRSDRGQRRQFAMSAMKVE